MQELRVLLVATDLSPRADLALARAAAPTSSMCCARREARGDVLAVPPGATFTMP